MTDKKKASITQPGAGGDNIVLVAGTVRVEPTLRELPSGDMLLRFDVVSGADTVRRTVPVSWEGPVRSVPRVRADDHLVVLGTVQRRFFRSGGATVHAVDVRAEAIARTPAARRKLRSAAAERLRPAD